MHKSRLILLIIFLLVFFGGLFLLIFPDPVNTSQQFTITQVDKGAILYLIKNPKQGSIHALSIQIQGNLDGKAIITKAYSKNSLEISDTISNKVDLNMSGDWYQDTCYILYRPLTCKTGELKINYKFFGMNNP